MEFHAFLSYNYKDEKLAKELYKILSESYLKIFFDTDHSNEGIYDKIEYALNNSQCMLLLVSPNGLGPVQKKEMHAFMGLNAHDSKRKIFVILLDDFKIENYIELMIRDAPRYKFLGIEKTNRKELYELTQNLQRDYIDIIADLYERPLLKNNYKSLRNSTINWYNQNAEMFYEKWKDQLPLSAIYEFVNHVSKLNKKPFILDAGCGPGHHTAFFSNQGFQVCGLDLANKSLDIAKKLNIKNTEFVCGNMTNIENYLKYPRNTFDGIWAAGSCIHIEDVNLGWQLNQFKAFLKPNGILGLTFQIGFRSSVDEGRFFERYRSHKVLIKKFKEEGFKILSESIDYDGLSTTSKEKIKAWAIFILKNPSEKKMIEISKFIF